MELQQHTNLKSVNIKQFIQCNKNAVYMRPIRYRILHVRPPLKQTKYIMLCYHNDCFSLTKIIK